VSWEAAVWNAERVRRRARADLEEALQEKDAVRRVQEAQWVLDDTSGAVDQLYTALGGIVERAKQWDEIREAEAFYSQLVETVLQTELRISREKKVLATNKQ
jgi:hypothetical protein